MTKYQFTEISSVSNQRIKDLVKLRNSSQRKKRKQLLIEGYRELTRALASGVVPVEIYFCEQYFLGENEPDVLQDGFEKGAKLFCLTKDPFKKISYRDRPDGLIAVAPQIGITLSELELSDNPLLVIAESIEKPGNLGTILRSADAVGADGVIVCDKTTDINNPNVVRASTGTLFTMPIVEAESMETLEWLKKKGIKILAATPHTENVYTQVDLNQPCAIAVGAEQYGLSEIWMEKADLKVKIPMAGVADSLNVATATTVLMFEAARQRKFVPSRISGEKVAETRR